MARTLRGRSRRCATRSGPAAGAARAAGGADSVLRRSRGRRSSGECAQGYLHEDRRSVHDHITRDIRPDDAEAFALLGEGQTYVDLPMHLRRYRSDIFTDKYKRLAWDEVSRSITAHIAKDGYWYIHPEQHRTLSVREAARVQTFPDWFRFAGQPSLRLKQIGNAVPPLLGKKLGVQIRAALDATPQSDERRRETSGNSSSRGTPASTGLPVEGRTTSPWLVVAAEVGLSRTRGDLVPVIYERLCGLAPSPRELLARR